MESVIQAVNVSKSYRQRPLYTDVNFEIPQGTITGLVGPNGSGKSVLLRLMCALSEPDSGSISISPRFLSNRRTYPDRFGIIIDRPGYLPDETGLDNLLQLAEIRKRVSEQEIRSLMQTLGLDPDLRQKMRHYSLGMKQKIAIAQAFMENPQVLLLDEPFNALDADAVTTVMEMIRDFHANGGTVVFTSHDSEHIRSLSQRMLTIRNGTVTTSDSSVAD
ncbi:ABC transporter ATP-binding protein [uncultured Gulosibacter sp.]|uniref:ABC transporter ATP-binding protein n=1 Tax=uncultured Gulosibacter sp. TaxID=1339167 RepID=UPI0028890BD2|nr:ABC transporter ATP-binding protein [uncultured Gulosibacter sp.]